MTFASQQIPSDMVLIPGGRFLMGSEHFYPEERPVRTAEVGAFLIDRHPVTNAAFARFVAETGHVTQAELPQPHPSIPGLMTEPCSAVFTQPLPGTVLKGPASWWRLMPGACWKHPTGLSSGLAGIEDHPVVHVALTDTLAYAEWAGKALPTEVEWEFAARGGLEGADYAWGDSLMLNGRHMANTWQGAFPFVNELADGFAFTSPVCSFPANGYGLFDMIGNVWEWTVDDYAAPPIEPARSCCSKPVIASGTQTKVIKGGSYLCAPNYCRRYRPAARHPQQTDMTTGHLGFRCIRRM